MNPPIQKECPLCGYRECKLAPYADRKAGSYECGNCGKFVITAEALQALGDEGWKLAPYVVQQNSANKTPVFYSSQAAIPQGAGTPDVGIDAVIASFPVSVPERLDRALMNLAAATRHLGQTIAIRSEGANPLLFAKNSSEVFFTIQHFESEGYIKGKTTSLPTEISATGKGLARVSDLQRGLFGSQNKQAFIAMSFHKTLDGAWADGLKLGIEDCSYHALRVDGKEHNDKICDVIIAEIRRSKFLVADFTLHRAGVYFEAGLMMGLGRPVIFTCRSDDLKNAHFDTRQYNHIAWDTPADLREKLKRRIQATIIP
jgi:hypothetical protein